MTNTDGFGQMDAGDTTTDFNRSRFHIDQMLMRTRTMVLVQVKSISGGGLNSPGTVSIQPLVNMIDGAGNSQAHGSINNIPYVRGQGGSNAIVNDPVVGEIGIALIADRDSSGVISGKAAANPGSRRRHDFADAIYLGSILGAKPNQYLQFLSNGLTLVDQNNNKLTFGSSGVTVADDHGNTIVMQNGSVVVTATTFQVNGAISATGNITSTAGNITATTGNVAATVGNVTAGANVAANLSVIAQLGASEVSLHTHHHTGVTTGAGTTGAPVPGT